MLRITKQAVQLELQLVIRHTRGCQGVQKLLSEEVAQVGMIFWCQTRYAMQRDLSSVHPFQDFGVEVVHHCIPAGDDGSLTAQLGVVHVWNHKLDGLFLAGGDSWVSPSTE